MSKSTAIISSGLASSGVLPPTYTLAVVSINPLSGKSSLCKRLVDINIDQYRLFTLKTKASDHQQGATWLYWGSVKHRRADEKREALFHMIEHSSLAIDENEHYDNYIKRISMLTLRAEEKFHEHADYPQIRTYPKDKVNIDGYLCLHDLSASKQISDLLFFLHALFKTRRPILIVTTKNDRIDNQSELAQQFEQSLRRSSSSDAQLLSNIPILHTSASDHVNMSAVLELALYACDEPVLLSTRKHSNANMTYGKYLPPTYDDAYRDEIKLKHVTQTEYRALLTRYVVDVRATTWKKFHANCENTDGSIGQTTC
jgi:hypothetical protein